MHLVGFTIQISKSSFLYQAFSLNKSYRSCGVDYNLQLLFIMTALTEIADSVCSSSVIVLSE